MTQSIVYITGEVPWPLNHGGRTRSYEVLRRLVSVGSVTLVFPNRSADDRRWVEGLRDLTELGLSVEPLAWADPGKSYGRLALPPRMGLYLLQPVRHELAQLLERVNPGVVYWSHSYLAAAAGRLAPGPKHIVEFANIEGDRYRHLVMADGPWSSRVSAGVEMLKAARWERGVARAASVSAVLNVADVSRIARWGGNAVLASNGVNRKASSLSPAEPVAVTVGTWSYPPNSAGLVSLLTDHWPRVRAECPGARLKIVGRMEPRLADRVGSLLQPGVELAGYVEDLSEHYASAALVIAPASSGGGQQLKVVEAMTHGRLVVGPSYVKASWPREGTLPDWLAADDYASVVARLLVDHRWRHGLEEDMCAKLDEVSWDSQLGALLVEIMDS